MDVVNKLLNTKSLLTMPSNVLPLHLKQILPPIIWIFTKGKGDEIKSRLPFKNLLYFSLKLPCWVCRALEALGRGKTIEMSIEILFSYKLSKYSTSREKIFGFLSLCSSRSNGNLISALGEKKNLLNLEQFSEPKKHLTWLGICFDS